MSEKVEKSLLNIDFAALMAWKHIPSPAASLEAGRRPCLSFALSVWGCSGKAAA